MKLLMIVTLMAFAGATDVMACSTCFGAPDHPTTQGIQMAVMSMLGVIGVMLGAFATLIIKLAKREKLTLLQEANSEPRR